jgi:hypothetical protein
MYVSKGTKHPRAFCIWNAFIWAKVARKKLKVCSIVMMIVHLAFRPHRPFDPMLEAGDVARCVSSVNAKIQSVKMRENDGNCWKWRIFHVLSWFSFFIYSFFFWALLMFHNTQQRAVWCCCLHLLLAPRYIIHNQRTTVNCIIVQADWFQFRAFSLHFQILQNNQYVYSINKTPTHVFIFSFEKTKWQKTLLKRW